MLQSHFLHRGENDVFILTRCAQVGELLFLGGVDVDVVVTVVLAHDHALVDRVAGLHKERAARFQIEQGVGHGRTGAVRHDGTGKTRGEVAAPLLVPFQIGIHDARALGVREKFVAVSDEPA